MKGDTRVEPGLVRFELLHEDAGTKARRGRLHTPHGAIETPIFMPVGTVGSVKGVGPDDLRRARCADHPRQHLPPDAAARRASWWARWAACTASSPGTGPCSPTAAASRSSASSEKRKITEEGAAFQSPPRRRAPPAHARALHRDPGDARRRHHHGVRRVPARRLRARAYLERSLARTTRWLHRCAKAWSRERSSRSSASCRAACTRTCASATPRRCARWTCPATRSAATRWARRPRRCTRAWPTRAPLLPRDKPRYLMGVGTPLDLVTCVEQRRGHVRLRAAHALRAQRPALHLRGQGGHQQRGLRARPAPGGPGVQLLHLPHLQPRLPAPPLRRRRRSWRCGSTPCTTCTTSSG